MEFIYVNLWFFSYRGINQWQCSLHSWRTISRSLDNSKFIKYTKKDWNSRKWSILWHNVVRSRQCWHMGKKLMRKRMAIWGSNYKGIQSHQWVEFNSTGSSIGTRRLHVLVSWRFTCNNLVCPKLLLLNRKFGIDFIIRFETRKEFFNFLIRKLEKWIKSFIRPIQMDVFTKIFLLIIN